MAKLVAIILGILLLVGCGALVIDTQMNTSHVPTPSQGQNGLYEWGGSFGGYIVALFLFFLSIVIFWYAFKKS